jgi:hypothetical protein
MKKLILVLLLVSSSAFAEVRYSCTAEGTCKLANRREPVGISGTAESTNQDSATMQAYLIARRLCGRLAVANRTRTKSKITNLECAQHIYK